MLNKHVRPLKKSSVYGPRVSRVLFLVGLGKPRLYANDSPIVRFYQNWAANIQGWVTCAHLDQTFDEVSAKSDVLLTPHDS